MKNIHQKLILPHNYVHKYMIFNIEKVKLNETNYYELCRIRNTVLSYSQ